MASLTTFKVAELRYLMKTEQIPEPKHGSGSKGNVIKPDLIQAIKTHRAQKVKKPEREKKPDRLSTSVKTPDRLSTSVKTPDRLSKSIASSTIIATFKKAWNNIDSKKAAKLSQEEIQQLVKEQLIGTEGRKDWDEKEKDLPRRIKEAKFNIFEKSRLAFAIQFEKYFALISGISRDQFNINFEAFKPNLLVIANKFTITSTQTTRDDTVWESGMYTVAYDENGVDVIIGGRRGKFNPVYFSIGKFIMEDDFRDGSLYTLLLKMHEINKNMSKK